MRIKPNEASMVDPTIAGTRFGFFSEEISDGEACKLEELWTLMKRVVLLGDP